MRLFKRHQLELTFIVVEIAAYFIIVPVSVESYLVKWILLYFGLALIMMDGLIKSFGSMKYISEVHEKRAYDKSVSMIDSSHHWQENKVENRKLSYKFFMLGFINVVMYLICLYI